MRLLGKLTAIIICVTLCAPALSIMPLAAEPEEASSLIVKASGGDVSDAAQGKSGTDFNRIVRALGLMG